MQQSKLKGEDVVPDPPDRVEKEGIDRRVGQRHFGTGDPQGFRRDLGLVELLRVVEEGLRSSGTDVLANALDHLDRGQG